MIRKLEKKDKEIFFSLMDEFYHSTAVMHQIPEKNYQIAFDTALSDGPYMAVHIVEKDEKIAGYAQISFTYSTEAGGLVLLVEELYFYPEFRNQGLGTEYFSFVEKEYGSRVARMRLEIEPENDDARRLYNRIGFRELSYVQMYRGE